MASKRRNIFYKNKKQETTEIEAFCPLITPVARSSRSGGRTSRPHRVVVAGDGGGGAVGKGNGGDDNGCGSIAVGGAGMFPVPLEDLVHEEGRLNPVEENCDLAGNWIVTCFSARLVTW
ncbi:hypothetical protein AAG570_006453 [Ranatra chinensis]|uniref:Uncharacterized protein n=1 Tax=Ranatra chinensis TaxID=642074 RepID=A0ABD0ZH95_9HEMI